MGGVLTNFLNTIILLGAVQGLIFSFMLFFAHKKEMAEKLLATMLLLMSLASLNIYLTETVPYWQMGLVLSLVPTILIMSVGPLLYFYIRFLLQPTSHWKPNYWFHFLPVMVDLAPIIVGWVLTIGFLLDSFSRDYLLEWGNNIDLYNSYSDIPRWLSITIYLLLGKRYFSKLISSPNKPKPHSKWVKVFLNSFLVFQLIWLIFLVPYVVPTTRFIMMDSLGYYPIYVPLSLFIYVLGIKGFLHSRQSLKENKTPSIRLTEQESKKLIKVIQSAMTEDKLYLEPDLELRRLVKHVGSDQRTVSHVLNHYFHMSFNTFVNHYRVEEVKQRMVVPEKKHLKLSGIAFECGFNSQSTFQRAFKQSTGLSPREYLSKQAELLQKNHAQY